MTNYINKVLFKLHLKKHKKDVFPNKTIESYYNSRTIKDKKYLCHAPFNNMYFNSVGDVANCWLTFDNPEKYSEDRTIKEIWLGEKFTNLRENIKNYDLSKRCGTCLKNLENKNHVNVLAKAYDNDIPISNYPTMMEFELSNTCNLECIMCTGLLSSAIRANREKLPKLTNPYGEKFVQELEEFIPYLHEARFNGGEPFLIKIYFDIWEKIIELNPNCKIVIATNGTVLTSKVKNILERGNFHFNISIDSLIAKRYAEIRVNGDLNVVLKNLLYFKEYCQTKKRNICIMVNPMKNNWEEMPSFIEFCNSHNVHLWFNTIVHPEELSIHSLPKIDLERIYTKLSKVTFVQDEKTTDFAYKHNTELYHNLVEIQIKNWLTNALDTAN